MTRAINCAIAAYTERESESNRKQFLIKLRSSSLVNIDGKNDIYMFLTMLNLCTRARLYTLVSAVQSAEWWAAMGKWIRGHDVKEALLQLQMSNPLRPRAILFQAYHLLIRSGQMKSLVLCEDVI